jgi:hypothetical protein
MQTGIRAAAAVLLKKRHLAKPDRDHLQRWASDDYADDPIWDRLATASRVRDVLPRGAFYDELVGETLFMRQKAESAASGIDFDLRHNQRFHEWQVELAKKADDLADFYKWAEDYSGIATFFDRFLQPVTELQQLHRREAAIFRQRTRRFPRRTVRTSRQDKSVVYKKGGLRKINAFIDLANGFLTWAVSENPNYEAIGILTEIAFPEFERDPEFVRTSLRPTTTRGRKARSRRTLAGKKS